MANLSAFRPMSHRYDVVILVVSVLHEFFLKYCMFVR